MPSRAALVSAFKQRGIANPAEAHLLASIILADAIPNNSNEVGKKTEISA